MYVRAIPFLIFCVVTLTPNVASAGVFSGIIKEAQAGTVGGTISGEEQNSQKMSLGTPSIGPGIIAGDAIASADVLIQKDAITPSMGPVGSALDVEDFSTNDQIVIYTVHKGDTLQKVAKMFDVSTATIVANNELKAGQALTEGMKLTILPTPGILVEVRTGDTLASIIKAYNKKNKADVTVNDVAFYNEIDPNEKLVAGDSLLIPDAELEVAQAPVIKKQASGGKISLPKITGGLPNFDRYFIVPIIGGIETQSIHSLNAVDIGAPIGTPVRAAVSGTVIAAKFSGYNTGYGKFVALTHTRDGRNFQTLYAHLSRVDVVVGQVVSQGDIIGAVGSTGHSTGPHTHFEARGVHNPFAGQKGRYIYIKQN